MADLSKIVADYEAAKEQMRTSGKAALGAAFKDFFDKYPEADRITWTQYTPHFNDGDACTFGVHEKELFLAGSDDELSAWSGDSRWPSAEMKDAFRELSDVPDELMELTFGDHVQVTATRNGFEVDGYNHD